MTTEGSEKKINRKGRRLKRSGRENNKARGRKWRVYIFFFQLLLLGSPKHIIYLHLALSSATPTACMSSLTASIYLLLPCLLLRGELHPLHYSLDVPPQYSLCSRPKAFQSRLTLRLSSVISVSPLSLCLQDVLPTMSP